MPANQARAIYWTKKGPGNSTSDWTRRDGEGNRMAGCRDVCARDAARALVARRAVSHAAEPPRPHARVPVQELPLADPDGAGPGHVAGFAGARHTGRGLQVQQRLGAGTGGARREHGPLVNAVERRHRAVAGRAGAPRGLQRQPGRAAGQRRQPAECRRAARGLRFVVCEGCVHTERGVVGTSTGRAAAAAAAAGASRQ